MLGQENELQNNIVPKNNSNNRVILSVIILILILGAFFTGKSYGQKEKSGADISGVINTDDSLIDVDFNTFWKTWKIINAKYVDNDTVDPQDKIWGAITGLARSLGDPYTDFLPPREAELFEENIQGNFGGVGMEIGIREKVLTVITPLKNTPAEKAGILAGDIVLAVDGKTTSDLSVDEAVSLIRGEIGSTVKLTLFRKGKDVSFDIEVVRDNIKIPTIESEFRSDGIFVIRLFNFSAISPHEFRDALRNFVKSTATNKLILDLRGNPGGFLSASVDMASWFLPAGKVVVTEDYREGNDDVVHRSKGYNIFNDNLDFVILVNQGSASASEILAGALREHQVATIVGQTTFGKGSVQELISITDDTSLKVTVAKWLTPLGNSISNGGIEPDVVVEMTLEDFEAGRDPQLDKAVEILLSE